MIKKIVCGLLIIVVIAFVFFLALYKKNTSGEYIVIDIGNNKKKVSDINLKDYSSDMVKNIVDNYEYEVSMFDHTPGAEWDINVKFYVKDGILYYKNLYHDYDTKLINDKVVQIMKMFTIPDDEYDKATEEYVELYVLTETNDLYHVAVEQDQEPYLKPTKVNNNIKVKNLTLINYPKYRDDNLNYIVVVGVDDKLYYMPNEALFEPKSVMVDDKYIYYSDGTISTWNGNMLKNVLKQNYIVKGIFALNSGNEQLKGSPTMIILTKDNRIIYTIEDKLYVYNKEVIEAKADLEKEENDLTIKFKDNTEFKFSSFYNVDYFDFAS